MENDEVADAELVDIDKAKPLSALAMDVEWGEQQLSSTSPRCAISSRPRAAFSSVPVPWCAKGNAAKLKLRNGVYDVVKRDNNRYDIRHVNYG